MKTLSLVILLLASSQGFASESSTSFYSEPYRNNGFSVGLLKSFLDVNSRTSSSINDAKESYAVKQDLGFLLGYNYIPARSVGFTTQLLYNSLPDSGKSLRLTGNLAANPMGAPYLFIGPNLHKFVEGEELRSLDAGLGYQAGLGLAFHNGLNVFLQYVEMRNKGRINTFFDTQDWEITLKGVEASVQYVF